MQHVEQKSISGGAEKAGSAAEKSRKRERRTQRRRAGFIFIFLLRAFSLKTGKIQNLKLRKLPKTGSFSFSVVLTA